MKSKKVKSNNNTFAAEEHEISDMIILEENRYKTDMFSYQILFWKLLK